MEEIKGKNEADIAEKMQHDHGDSNTENLKSMLLPLMEKIDQLRESMDRKYTKLEDAISTQQKEMSAELRKIDETIATQQS